MSPRYHHQYQELGNTGVIFPGERGAYGVGEGDETVDASGDKTGDKQVTKRRQKGDDIVGPVDPST